MISIIISIRPEWACKILNRDKQIEVRKGLALYNVLKRAEERGEQVEFLMYVTAAKPYLDYIEQYDDDSGYWYQGNYQLDYDKLKKLPKPKKGMTEDDQLFDDYTYNDMVLRAREARKDGSLYNEHYYNLNGKVVARFRADPARIRLKRPRNYDDWGGYYYIGKGGDLVTEIELGAMSCLYHEQLDGYLQGKPGTALEISGLEILEEPKDLADYGLKRAPQSWCYAKKGE